MRRMWSTALAAAVIPALLFFAACTQTTGGDPPLTGTVSITGTAKVGETLTANTGSLGGDGDISYQWLRGDTGISGATGSSYKAAAADVAQRLKVRVGRAGYSGTITSDPTAAVAAADAPNLTGTVSITGTATVGQTLTANTESLGGSGAISYRWFRGDTELADVAGNTYTPGGPDVGQTITVKVSRAGYAGELTSDPTAAVVPYPFTTPQTYRDMVSLDGGTITGSLGGYWVFQDNYEGVFIYERTVTVSPFAIATYETTYELWYEVKTWAAEHGYTFANAGREGHDGTDGAAPTTGAKTEPVTMVSWRDAIVWCNAYSELSGKAPVYYYSGSVVKDSGNSTACDNAVMDAARNGYRLPTEAEWEYAARGGGEPSFSAPFTDKWAGTNTESSVVDCAVYIKTSTSTATVGTKSPNTPAGLYDMSGNVFEWCWDWYADSVSTGTTTDPTGADSGSNRVKRGGAWSHGILDCSVVYRSYGYPNNRYNNSGFRVVSP